MAARFTITRMLVVCLLSRAVDSSALAKAGSAADHRLWPGGTPTQVGVYSNRRPLQYITSLREENRNKQLVQPEPRQNHRVDLGRVPGPARIQSQLNPRMRFPSPSWQQSDVTTNRAQKIPHQLENQAQLTPRGFHFDLKIPLLSSLIPKIGTSNARGSGLDRGGAQSAGPAEGEPSSVEIHSGLGLPSISTDGAKEPNGKPKPSFHLKLVVPIRPSVQPQTAPSSAAKYWEGQKQESSGLIQSSHVEHSTGEQSGASSSAGAAQKHPNKMLHGISTLFGSRRPVETSAGGGRQTVKPVNVRLQSGSTLVGAQRPFFGSAGANPQSPNEPLWARPTFGATSPSWGSAGAAHRETYQPADPKVPSGPTQVGAEESFGGFSGAAPQDVYSRVDANQQQSSLGPVGPHWGSVGGAELESRSTLFGAGRPSWTSAGGVQEHAQTYDPKVHSSSTIAGAQRPLLGSAVVNRQYSYTPVETKPQSGSADLGAQGPAWGSAGAAQQHAIQPAETNLQSRRQWPSWSSAIGTSREQTYGPVFMKPHPGSSLGGSRKPSWGATGDVQQNTPIHKPIEIQVGSSHVGIGNPSMGFTDATQHPYKPVETKPHVDSTLIGAHRPPFSSFHWQKFTHDKGDAKPQTGSTQLKVEKPSGSLADGGQQVYQPTSGQLRPSEGLSSQQYAPVDQYGEQTGLTEFPNTDATNVYSSHMTQTKPDNLTSISSGSTNLRLWPSNYKGPWQNLYSVQEKPSASNGHGQPSGLGGSLLPGASQEYNYHRYNPSVTTRPQRPTVPPPAAAPSWNRRPPFVLDREPATSSNYDTDKTVELVQKYFSNWQRGDSRGNAAPPKQPSSGLLSSSMWRPSAQPEFQTGRLRQDSNTMSLDGRNRYSQQPSGAGTDGWNNYSVHLGSTDDGVYSPGSNEGRRLMSPNAPALPPVNSRVDAPHDGQFSGFAHHLQPSENSQGNVPGSIQPVVVKIRKHDLLIV